MDQSPKTRASLLLRIADSQDEQAWAEFVDIYEPLVYRLARRNGFQDADARELTQELLLAIAKAVKDWDPDPARGSFRGWLYQIARNLMINLIARQRKHPLGVGSTDFQRLLEQQPTTDASQSAGFDLEYKRELFRWAAEHVRANVHDQTWQAFWKTCVDGRRVRQVARELNMSVGAVYVARSRVMARLKKKVQSAQALE